MPKIKHISIAFCKVSEVPLTMNHADWKALESRDPGAWNRMSPPQRLGQAHASAIGYLESDRSHIWSGLHLLTGCAEFGNRSHECVLSAGMLPSAGIGREKIGDC
jgi:hypothetical protein